MFIIAFWFEYRWCSKATAPVLWSSGFKQKAWCNQWTGMSFGVKQRSLGNWGRGIGTPWRHERTDHGDSREVRAVSCCSSVVLGKFRMCATACWYLWDTHASPCMCGRALVTGEGREGDGSCVDTFPSPGVSTMCPLEKVDTGTKLLTSLTSKRLG